ncbi:DUF1672 family protein [Alkalihalobacterium chitinilyticum]|uniref:DUF1672 domain-containing protein n=1 Tax=Alkalihalobacterium chitinilyticum TaxID=2980103 RepID=A0ABT5VFX6_9BACI|nr:DUF1672 family protein [Alkalihalobacterium chitinilyticum]MDE5414227.1 DUF1672 domain-containing protein [Alkalihalobacterium chitinilyticum]
MKIKSIVLAISLIIPPLMIGGCNAMDEITETPEERHAREVYVSVNDYTGEGYRLPDGQLNDPIAKEKFEEIAEATQSFFLEEYKTEVTVHNAVGAKHGIMVFVESPNEPKFHTFAMMPVDANEGKIFPDDIWTVEMQVESAIFSGLFAMMIEEELKILDEYFKELTNKYPVVGIRQEAMNNVTKSGYTTPYYFISHLLVNDEFLPILELYLNNPEVSKEELLDHFDVMEYDAEQVNFAINLYMKEFDTKPDEKLFQQILSDIETRNEFPRGSYSIRLYDNNINKHTGNGNRDNRLVIRGSNKIMRQ